MHPEQTQFIKDREDALLSLDKAKIKAYMLKYGVPIPADDVFWMAVHRAISLCTTFPDAARQKSKEWLDERGHFQGRN